MFHAKDGWHFWRNPEDGSVVIYYPNPNEDTPHIKHGITLDASGWASVVASVSRQGGAAERFYQALKFHMEREGE